MRPKGNGTVVKKNTGQSKILGKPDSGDALRKQKDVGIGVELWIVMAMGWLLKVLAQTE